MAVRSHVEWLREGVSRWNRRRKRVTFVPDLSGVRFFDFLPPDFRDDPKTSRTFERINLSSAILRGADLSHSNFQKANFREADLRDANLSQSNFDESSFVGADLLGANASFSSFDGAIFEDAQIMNVEFEGTSLSGTIFVAVEAAFLRKQVLEALGAQVFETTASYKQSKEIELPRSSGDTNLHLVVRPMPKAKTPKNMYDVFFGTTRQAIISRGAVVDYNDQQSDAISYGLCEVILPAGQKRRVGSLGSPLWKRLLNSKDDRLDLKNLIALDEELFFQHLADSANRMTVKQHPTIFIHGFNNTFENAVLRAAQIGFDLKIGQGVGLFSWPSKGKTLAYSADEASAESNKYYLADFIAKFIDYSPTGQVNIIAHSMGCRCLLGSLEVLSNGRKKTLRRVNQIILAAADVDSSIMPRLGLAATKYAKRTTSYVSGHDKALKISGWLHSYPRVGFMPPTFVMSGMDTILVNNDDLGTLSHSYVGSNREVLNDIFNLLKSNDDPSLRFSLVPADGGIWRIRS